MEILRGCPNLEEVHRRFWTLIMGAGASVGLLVGRSCCSGIARAKSNVKT